MNFLQLLRKTSPYIVLVVLAFTIMIAVSYLSANDVFEARTEESVSHMLNAAERSIVQELARADLQLLNTGHQVRRLMDRGVGHDVILESLRETSLWLSRDSVNTPGFMALYAFIGGVLINTMEMQPGPDFRVEQRPWYLTAQGLIEGETAFSPPYTDARTRKPVMSAVRNIYGEDGSYYGTLVLDFDLAWFSEEISSVMSLRGYGMIISPDFYVVGHPDASRLGRHLDELSYDFAMSSTILRENGRVWNRRITDLDGEDAMLFIKPIVRGWYAALVMPLDLYRNDLYDMEINPVFIGLILILLFSLLILRINAAQIRSDEISAYKSAFLAQMSHEVRTPMNTVLGMSELALRENDHSRAMEYVEAIKRATHSLLSIINDILDISRIESGTLHITPAPYFLSSLLNDVFSMIRVQLVEKPVLFTANVDAWIPNAMIGDETRIKQILINILSNAAKYTPEGHVSLDIKGAVQDSRTVLLTIRVADTGIGIKKADLQTLFENFVRLDAEKNQGIEGSGLGLVITRNLCHAMGGNITVQSEYGKGSVFTATVVQKFENDGGIAAVDFPEEKRVLCFEEQELYSQSIMSSLEGLGVPAKLCTKREEFFRELDRGGYKYAFVTAEIAGETVDRIKTGFLPTIPVLLANPGEVVSIQQMPMLTMPAWVVPIANILNNRSSFGQRRQKQLRFIIPDARILVVDDIATNVKVAAGLLALFQPVVDTCYDGHTAVDLARRHHYDLIFLDHMMPGMDGIETASAIRAMKEERFQSLPMVALTANAIFGMREMFIQNGFNDYLSKPVEITKLEEILAKWIPREKQIQIAGNEGGKIAVPFGIPQGMILPPAASFAGSGRAPETGAENSGVSEDVPSAADEFILPPPDMTGAVPVEGLNIAEGMRLTASPSWAAFRDVLAIFCDDALTRAESLKVPSDAGELPEFSALIHALKGALNSIGAVELAKQALELETAGKAGDLETARDLTLPFRSAVIALTARISAVLRDSAPPDAG